MKDIKKILEVLRDKDLQDLVLELKEDINALNLHQNSAGVMRFFYQKNIESNQKNNNSYIHKAYNALQVLPSNEDNKKISRDVFISRIKKGIKEVVKAPVIRISKIISGIAGAWFCVTDSGPPDRIMPLGLKLIILVE